MRHDPTLWLLARASGLTAYVMLTASTLVGLTLKSRPVPSLKPVAVLDLHRFLALLGLGALAGHAIALVLDTTVHVRLAGLLVPGFLPYRPLWTALGVLATEFMILVYVSFSVRKRIGTENWRRLHWATYGIFGAATLHGVGAGTDTTQPWATGIYAAAVAAVAAATTWRLLVPPSPLRSRSAARRRGEQPA